MLVGGLQKTTLLDYPDKVAATIFTIGCNFRCSFCHNPEIVKGIARVTSNNEILKFLKSRKKLLEAVCITGGEPTIHRDLPGFIQKLKSLGFLVKLDTNGTNPTMLKKLMKTGQVDYVAMDIKHRFSKYKDITQIDEDLTIYKDSIEVLINSNIDYEFRTTVIK